MTSIYESLPQRPPRVRKRPRPPPPDAAPASSPRPSTPPPACDTPASTSLARCRGVPAFEGALFSYHDHTADIQVHGWGPKLGTAFAAAALGMVHYMTPLDGVATHGGGGEEEGENSSNHTRTIFVSGHDAQSALYAFLDDVLFAFVADGFVCAAFEDVAIDREAWSVTATARGEAFDPTRHAAGTEVKAITYSAMAIEEGEGAADVHVIVDI